MFSHDKSCFVFRIIQLQPGPHRALHGVEPSDRRALPLAHSLRDKPGLISSDRFPKQNKKNNIFKQSGPGAALPDCPLCASGQARALVQLLRHHAHRQPLRLRRDGHLRLLQRGGVRPNQEQGLTTI